MSLVVNSSHIRCERDDRVLFNALSFAVEQGDLVQIRGRNGAGKTTFIRGLLGLNDLLQGDIVWHGDYQTETSLTYIGHKSGMSPYLTAEENLEFQSALKGNAVSTTQIEFALAQVGLKGFEDSLVQQMSAGQQRRVALAQLWLPQRQHALWVLDEPFTALDVQAVALMEQRLIEFTQQGGTVLFTSHQTPQLFTPQVIELGVHKS